MKENPIKSAGEYIDEVLKTWKPEKEDLLKVQQELRDLGQDPKNAEIVLAVRKQPSQKV